MKHSVAGIVRKNGLFFVARRIPSGEMGCHWEFPGGKVENDEAFQETLIREYKEEFNLNISVGKQITTGFFIHNDKKVKLIAYEVFFNDEDINWILTEHSEVKWVELNKIPTQNFVDSDLMLYDAIKRFYEGRDENQKKTE